LEIIGDKNVINGNRCTVTGNDNTVTGKTSTVKGNNNMISGDDVVVFGNSNIITGKNSCVIGNDNMITGDNAVVDGNGNTITGKNSGSTGNNAVIVEDSINDERPSKKRQVFTNSDSVTGIHQQFGTGSSMTTVNDRVIRMSDNISYTPSRPSYENNDALFTRFLQQGSGNSMTIVDDGITQMSDNTSYTPSRPSYENNDALFTFTPNGVVLNTDLIASGRAIIGGGIQISENGIVIGGQTIKPQSKRKIPDKVLESPASEDEKAENLCVICIGKLKTTVIVDCGHSCLRNECARKILENGSNCPLCRANIVEGIIQKY
jgi:hypothetical protein